MQWVNREYPEKFAYKNEQCNQYVNYFPGLSENVVISMGMVFIPVR